MKVQLIAHTPDPEKVCGIGARTCTSKRVPMLGFATDTPIDRALEHAMDSGHLSVLEHATFTFAIEGISRVCSHQLVRHRMASYSQQSQRYVDMRHCEYVIPESIRQSGKMVFMRCKSGSGTVLDAYCDLMNQMMDLYDELMASGIPKEDARYILPEACCTNLVVTMNARELLHFFEERLCKRAQWEIREMAEKMLAECREVAPAIFGNVGGKCLRLGYCPESKGCGQVQKRGI